MSASQIFDFVDESPSSVFCLSRLEREQVRHQVRNLQKRPGHASSRRVARQSSRRTRCHCSRRAFSHVYLSENARFRTTEQYSTADTGDQTSFGCQTDWESYCEICSRRSYEQKTQARVSVSQFFYLSTLISLKITQRSEASCQKISNVNF
jgi:hypothetical protein